MKTSTVSILAGVALAIFGYIVLVERHGLTDIETANRGARLIRDFARPRVTRIVVERPEQAPIVIQRGEARDEDNPFSDEETYVWTLEEPLTARASDDAIDALLGALEWAEPRRKIEGVGESELEEYGLATPAISVTLTIANETTTLRIGAEDATNVGRYAVLDDPSVLYVVGTDVFEAADHDANHFRSRELFPDPFIGMREITIERGGETLALARLGDADDESAADERWELRRPMRMLASAQRVRDIRRELGALEATRFVTDVPDDAFGESYVTLRSRARPAEGEAERPVELSVGAPCGEHEGERYARAFVEAGASADTVPVVCVEVSDIEVLLRGASELRELRPFTAPDTDVAAVEVVVGNQTMRVADDDGEWSYRISGQGPVREGEVDPDAFSEWLFATWTRSKPRSWTTLRSAAVASTARASA